MSSNKRLIISLGILSCILFGCGTPNATISSNRALITNDYADLTKDSSPEERLKTLHDFCVKNFKNTLPQKLESDTKNWNNRGRAISSKRLENTDARLIDYMGDFSQIIKFQTCYAKAFSLLPEAPEQLLIEKAKKIAAIKDQSQQKEYWGNLEFYLGSYTLELLDAIEFSSLSVSEKKEKKNKVVEGFYRAYEKAFFIISGIQLNFKKMCEDEKDYGFCAFQEEGVETLTLVKGVPIWVMESLGLLWTHPITKEAATLANLCRGFSVTTTKELASADSFNDSQFLISFASAASSYVRKTINEVSTMLVRYVISWKKVYLVQESTKFLFRIFREVIDLRKKEVLIVFSMLRKEDPKLFLDESPYIIKEKGKLVFVMDRNSEEYASHFFDCLNIKIKTLGDEIAAEANKKVSKILKNNPNAEVFPINLSDIGMKDIPV